eukprot:496483_1
MPTLAVLVYFTLHLATTYAYCGEQGGDYTCCDDYFECEHINHTDVMSYCYGFGSCYGSSISSYNSTYCDGAYSCHTASIDSSQSVFCRSIASCASATLKSTSLYCEGIASCSYADIEAYTVYSYGHYGSADSVISGASTIRAYGYYSLLYSVVDSTNVPKMSVKLFGVDAGYGANIVCQSGSSCTVTCKGSGCLETDVICLNGASCSVSPEECLSDNSVNEYEGISCPQWKVSKSADEDDGFHAYIRQKEIEKEENIKWKLFQAYISADMDSFEALIGEREKDKVLNGNLGLSVDSVLGTNMHLYLVATIVSFVLVALICAMNRCNDQYMKL